MRKGEKKAYLDFEELLYGYYVGFCGICLSFSLCFEHKAWRKCMPVLALFAAAWTFPEPAKSTDVGNIFITEDIDRGKM